MELTPNEPPGHGRRKLRSHLAEIHRLRAEGYTIRAIHQALENAGIDVSWATVQREVVRPERTSKPTGKRIAQVPSAPQSDPAVTRGKATATADLDRFFDSHISNPLFKRKHT